uniref:Uncharacterized protein n=1 Tax=Arundo donax TaxID=35708 RepID=A0A0A9FE49_ARUDO
MSNRWSNLFGPRTINGSPDKFNCRSPPRRKPFLIFLILNHSNVAWLLTTTQLISSTTSFVAFHK